MPKERTRVTRNLVVAMKRDYALGTSINEIADKNSLTRQTVAKYIKMPVDKDTIKAVSDSAVQHFEQQQQQLNTIKNQALNFIKESLTEAMDMPGKIAVIDKVKGVLDVVDRIQRLDSDKPTQITENKVTKLDLNLLLDQLETREDKNKYLLSQLHGETIDIVAIDSSDEVGGNNDARQTSPDDGGEEEAGEHQRSDTTQTGAATEEEAER